MKERPPHLSIVDIFPEAEHETQLSHNITVLDSIIEQFNNVHYGKVCEFEDVPTDYRVVQHQVPFIDVPDVIESQIVGSAEFCITPCSDPDGLYLPNFVDIWAEPFASVPRMPVQSGAFRLTSTNTVLRSLK